MAEDRIYGIGAEADVASTKTLREFLIEQSEKPNARATFKTTISRLGEKIRVTEDGPLMSLLDLTADEIKKSPNIIERALIDPKSAIQKLEAIRIAEGKVRNPYLQSIIKDIDQALGKKGARLPDSYVKNLLRNKLGDKAYDTLTHYSLSGKQSKYIMPEAFYVKSEKAIATMKNLDDKAITSLIYLGGFRNRDLAKVRIENIDFLTGEMFGATKVGQVEGVFNPAMMDIIREHVKRTGGRTSGLLFEGLTEVHKTQGIIFKNSVASRINKHLRSSFGGPVDMRTPGSKYIPSVTVKENMSLKIFRHANEDLYNIAGIVGPDREVATMRPVTKDTRGQHYGDPTVDKTPAKDLQTKMTALKASYSRRTAGSLLKYFGYLAEDISKATTDIVPSKDYILEGREKFRNFVQKSFPDFFDSLPTGQVIIPKKGIDVSGVQSAIDLSGVDAKNTALLQEGENIELERQNLKDKGKLEKEKLTLKEQMQDLKANKALERKINTLSDTEKARYERFKVKFPDATPGELYDAVKGKGSGYVKMLKNYSGKIIASKGLKGIGLGILGGELTRRMISKAETAEFGPDEDSTVAKIGNALGLSVEDMAEIGKSIRHVTNVASSVPIIGTAALPAELAATIMIPSQEEADLGASMRTGVIEAYKKSVQEREEREARYEGRKATEDVMNLEYNIGEQMQDIMLEETEGNPYDIRPVKGYMEDE